MLSASSCLRRSSSSFALTCTAFAMAVLSAAASAQQAPSSSTLPDSPVAQQSRSQPTNDAEQTVTIPAGTRLEMVLTHPLDSKTTHRGDEVYAQISAPVTLEDRVAIPAGTFVQGRVESMHRDGSRAVITMQSASLAFPNGYVATIRGPLQFVSEEGTAWNDPTTVAKTGALIAPFAGSGIGLAIGSAFHDSSSLGGMTINSPSPKALGIGSLVGLGAGGAVSLILLARSHHFYMQEGSALYGSLPLPVTLSASQIAASNDAASQSPPPVVARRPPPAPIPASANSGICYIPGNPGTPGSYIPGTPAIGNSPGTPGTYIPGIAATPPIPYPCP